MRPRIPKAHALPRPLPQSDHPDLVAAVEANLQHLAAALREVQVQEQASVRLVERDPEPGAPPADHLIIYALDDNGISAASAMDAGGTKWQIGRDGILVVQNPTAAAITKGQAVYLSGAAAGVPTIAPAKADLAATMPSLGLLLEEIPAAGFGRAMRFGVLSGVNTSTFAAGDELYVDAVTAGALTATAPTGSAVVQKVGRVLEVHATTGKILVDPQPVSTGVPSGLIGIWKGAVAAVPSGWALCDGTNGTPDLRDKFVKGAVSDTPAAPAPGESGGAKTHTHASHSHTPAGTVSQPTFTGNALASHQHELPFQIAGGKIRRINSGTFGNSATSYTSAEEATTAAAAVAQVVALSGSTSAGTPSGTVSQPTFSGAAATLTHDSPNHEPPWYALAFIMKL